MKTKKLGARWRCNVGCSLLSGCLKVPNGSLLTGNVCKYNCTAISCNCGETVLQACPRYPRISPRMYRVGVPGYLPFRECRYTFPVEFFSPSRYFRRIRSCATTSLFQFSKYLKGIPMCARQDVPIGRDSDGPSRGSGRCQDSFKPQYFCFLRQVTECRSQGCAECGFSDADRQVVVLKTEQLRFVEGIRPVETEQRLPCVGSACEPEARV